MDENVGHVLRALRDAGLEADTRVIYTSDHGDNVGARGLWGKSTLYEESAGVPLIVAGPDVPAGPRRRRRRCRTSTARRRSSRRPACRRASAADALPGASLFAVADGATPARPVISEYHAIGSVAGAFMLRFGRWKYCHYVAYRPQLFDLDADPEELDRPRRRPALRAPRSPKASGCCARRSIRKRSTRARSGDRPSCSRSSAAARRRSRAATSASRPRPGTAAEMN